MTAQPSFLLDPSNALDVAFANIARAHPGYRPRAQQQRYAREVERAFRDNARLVIEGPTGVGKTFGALLPAVLSGKKTLYVTASIALQDQLCIGPLEKVLTAELLHIPASEVKVGMNLVGFDEERVGHRRALRETIVYAVETIRRPSYRLHFDDGSHVICSKEHLWLCARGPTIKWLSAEKMVPTKGKRAGSSIIRVTDTWESERTYAAGYMAAAVDGEGWLVQNFSKQNNGVSTKLGFSQNKNEMLDAMREFLLAAGLHFADKRHGRDKCRRLEMYNRADIMAFLGKYRPRRLLGIFDPNLLGTLPTGRRVRLLAKEEIGTQDVVSITTSSKTLIVNGLASHNCDKDLPFLQKHVRPFTYALVKGRSNYLCLDAHARAEVELAVAGTDAERAVAAWGRLTLGGDRKESPSNDAAVWRRFSVSSEECLGDECEHRSKCFALKALREAQQADVVVVNYHLLFAHLKVVEVTGGHVRLLPAYQAIVMDEAHEARDIALEFFGFKLTGQGLRRLAHKAARYGADAEPLVAAATDFFGELGRPREKGPRRLRKPDEVRSWRALVAQLRGVEEALSSVDDDPAAKKVSRLALQHAAEVEAAMTLGPLAGSPAVYYVEDDRGHAVLHGKPLDVRAQVSRAYPLEGQGPAVLTSATVTVGGSFEVIVNDLAVDLGTHRSPEPGVAEVRTVAVESPYDWAGQAIVVAPRLPEGGLPGDVRERDRALVEVVRRARGRTLVLCTSNARVRAARDVLAGCRHPFTEGCGHTVLAQGDMPLAQLVEAFREDVGSVLVGTSSLWKGVDVAGEALSCVVIDKLPFDVWTDPLVEARREHNGADGWKLYVADAVVRFRQGVGRLIRHEDDRGVVVVLDGRLHTKPYGRTFLKSLPSGMRMSADLADVGAFLGDGQS